MCHFLIFQKDKKVGFRFRESKLFQNFPSQFECLAFFKMSHTFSHNRVVTSYLPLLLTQSVSETYHPNALVKKMTSKSILFV
jgi:hypothetical protein